MADASRYMLDTNMASHIIRGANEALREKLRATPMADLCISTVTEGELLYGLARKPEATSLQAAVQGFLLRVDALPWDSAAADTYGRLRARLESEGTPMGNLDTMIAAHALAEGCVVVTRDKAFSRVPGLQVEDWSTAGP